MTDTPMTDTAGPTAHRATPPTAVRTPVAAPAATTATTASATALPAQPAGPAPLAPPAADLRPLMSAFPSGVSVVTALDENAVPRGMTCSSLASVALDPAVLVVCLRTGGPTSDAVLGSGRFTLNLLHEDARDVSDLFASQRPDRFERVVWRLPLGASGPHLTEAALATADCTVVRAVPFGDHTAVFGHVTRVAHTDTAAPLLYGRRRYARWSAAAAAPEPRRTEGEPRVRP
ncbi:flavin reductase family protein [Streptomyces sp. NPDC060243]|uniref:flavin reductase family protein n=1 Tax=Streptomyces sp. NPDC060243 TaxID=3347081 RepID=UPI003663B497